MTLSSVNQPFWQSILHLAVLSALGIAHPVLDLSAQNAAFYVARKSQPIDLLFLVLVLCLIIPLLLALVPLVLGRRILRRSAYGLIFFILCSIILIPVVKFFNWTALPTFMLTCSASLLITFLYFRYQQFRSSITFLTPVVLIVPVLFLFHPRISKIASISRSESKNIKIESKAPIIMIVFDEFPLKSLLDSQGKIDSQEFPGFFNLSRRSFWFRNATSVSDATTLSIPAILTGKYAQHGLLPNQVDYPHNLMALLQNDYEIRAIEYATDFTPSKQKRIEPFRKRISLLFSDLSAIYLHHLLPKDQTIHLPVITQTWGNFWAQRPKPQMGVVNTVYTDLRGHQLRRFIASINRFKRPRFYFLHTMLPHVPWQYLSDGSQYNRNGIGYFGVDGLMRSESWINEPAAIDLAIKRHRNQVQFIDRLIQEFLDHLEKKRMFDRSLIVVTADHGMSFASRSRRRLTRTNYEDIIRVPLFLKLPFQESGAMSDRNVQLIDLLPTIQQALKITGGWEYDGRSLLDNSNIPNVKQVLSIGQTFLFPGKWNGLQGFDNHEVETYPHLIGKRLQDLTFAGELSMEVRLHNKELFRNVDLKSKFYPSLVTADFNNRGISSDSVFGIVINDIFAGSTHSFRFGTSRRFISCLADPSFFRQGKNEVKIILLSDPYRATYKKPQMVEEEGQPVFDFSKP